MSRIPHGNSPVEIRKGFQRMEASVGILLKGTGNQYLSGQGVGVYPVWIDPIVLTAGSGLAGGGDISVDRTFDLDINSLSVATIYSSAFIPFWDTIYTATNKKTTFTNFEAALTHNNLISGTIADHDTGATGIELDTLTDNSIANALHRHTELVASDGSPDPALSVDSIGRVGIGTSAPDGTLELRSGNSILRIRDTGDTATATTAYVEFGGTTTGNWSRTGYVGDTSSGDTHIRLCAVISNLILGDSSSDSVLTLQGGNVIATGAIQAEQLTSLDDITMAGHLLTMGDAGATIDTVLSFLGNTNSASITFDESDDLFNYGDAGIATSGALTGGGSGHDQFSDYVGNEHIDHTGVTITAGSGLAGTASIESSFTLALDINSLAVATIVSGDFVPFWDITATATNKKTTFANFEAALTHDNLIAGTIASHDTSATGAQLDSLTDNSIVNTLHRHTELVASDGIPDPALSVNTAGTVTITPVGGGMGLNIVFPAGTIGTPSFECLDRSTVSFGIFNSTGPVRYYGMFFNVEATTSDFLFKSRKAYSDTEVWRILNTNQHTGFGATAPDARLEIETTSSEGHQAITIDQNDEDKAFIDFQGTSAADATKNITSWTTGNTIQGFTRQEINGAVFWMPYYDAPTS